MQKIVITYYSGSEYDGSDIIICLEYESAEKFIVEFENIAKETYKKYRDNISYLHRLNQELSNSEEYKNYRMHPNHTKFKEKYLNLYKEHCKKTKKIDLSQYNKFTFGGVVWDTCQMFDIKNQFCPTIQTLDEWFECKKLSNY